MCVHALRRTLDAISRIYMPPSRAADPAVRALTVRHSVPAAGYLVSDGEVSVFCTGDTGPGLRDVWERTEPNAILT